MIDRLGVQVNFRIPSPFNVVHGLDHLIFRQVGVKLWDICNKNLIRFSAENPYSSCFVSRQAECVLLCTTNSHLRIDNWPWHNLNPCCTNALSFEVISINEHRCDLSSHSFPTTSQYGERWWIIFPVLFGLRVRHNEFEIRLVLVLETRDDNLEVRVLGLVVPEHIVDRGKTGLDKKWDRFVLSPALLNSDRDSTRVDRRFRCYSVLIQAYFSVSQKFKNHRKFLLFA